MVHAKGLPAVVDGTDDIVVAITTTGVAAIDLTLEAPTPSVRKRISTAAALSGPSAQHATHAAPRVRSELTSDRPQLKRSKIEALK